MLAPPSELSTSGDNHELTLRDGVVRGRIWKRPDLDMEQGAENARQLEATLLGWLQHRPKGLYLDVSEGPEVAGPKTEATIGTWFRAYAQARVGIAVRVGPSAVQKMQYQRLTQAHAGALGHVSADADECLRFLGRG
jgi:hypothetical protein